MANSNSSTSYPALTTTFTPAPECTQLTISSCYGTDHCLAVALSDSHCTQHRANCFPDSSIYSTTDYTYVTPYLTYSPGSFCPLGWSTAASALSPDGVWCCPTGFSFDRGFQACQATLTEGTAVSVGTGCSILSTIPFGPGQTNSLVVGSLGATGSNTVPASQLTIQASAQGIFLLGQSLSTQSSATSPSSSSTLESNSPTRTGSDGDPSTVSTKTAIGASIGSAMMAVVLFSLGFYLIRRHRKRKLGAAKGEEGQDPPAPGAGDDDHHGAVKPELEGSNADPAQFKKAELDPEATRSELEGPVSKELEGKEVRVTRELDGNERPQELPGDVVRYELE
ncbi:hypothetical protein F5Y13DRAFT_176122 [Hypoxylon sp. FL1857]|nr:hypothetical protein F5Y13DRAFT_176122 [Hypoxylon sp. FL1857]